MTALYIANGTRQIRDFYYRLPEVTQPRRQEIRVGGQIKITGDLSTPEIEHIVNQHRKYGMVPVDEIEKGKGQAPLCYSIGKPVTPDKIARLMRRNQRVQVEVGKQTREDAAVVMNNRLEHDLRESGIPSELRELDVSMVEEVQKGAPEAERIAEGVKVRRGGRKGAA